MRITQSITFGVTGQSLTLDVQEGRPSAVTVTVYEASDDDDQGTEAAHAAAAVETNPATTTSAAAGAGQANPRTIALTAATGVTAGRTYQIRGVDGLREWVEVAAVNGTTVTAAHKLLNAYASGAAFESTRVAAAVDAAWVADETNLLEGQASYRARWVYTVGGVQYVRDTYFDLVRYAGHHGVTAQDVDALVPGWVDRLPTDHRTDQGRRIIAEAYRCVATDLSESDRTDERVANGELHDQLVKYKAIELSEFARYMAAQTGDPSKFETARLLYQQRLDALVRSVARMPEKGLDGQQQPARYMGVTQR